MKLHEIIQANEVPTQSILIENILKYKKSLSVYYKDYFCMNTELVLMVTDVFNAAQYGKIVSSNELYEAICEYMGVDYVETDETETNFDDDIFAQYETICFNSIPFSKL